MSYLKKTIFDSSNLVNASDNIKGGQYGISLYVTPYGNKENGNRHSLKIEGTLKSGIDWNVAASWENINPSGILSVITGNGGLLDTIVTGTELVMAVGSTSITNSGLFTRKYYKNSGYLNIKPSFRIFDYNNNGNPVNMGLILSSLCLPTIDPKASFVLINNSNAEWLKGRATTVIDNGGNLITKIYDEITGLFRDQTDAEKQNTQQTSDIMNAPKRVVTGGVNSAIDNIKGSKVSVSHGPDTVIVEIGNWLRLTDMIIESVNITYSEQMTDMGPLYADIDLQMSSLEAMSYDPTTGGISQMQMTSDLKNLKRVTFKDSNNTNFQG